MLYFELLNPFKDRQHGILEPGVYAKDMQVHNGRLVPGMIVFQANRIWIEQDSEIKYLKHRNFQDATVDMKEFSWVKLKAKVLT